MMPKSYYSHPQTWGAAGYEPVPGGTAPTDPPVTQGKGSSKLWRLEGFGEGDVVTAKYVKTNKATWIYRDPSLSALKLNLSAGKIIRTNKTTGDFYNMVDPTDKVFGYILKTDADYLAQGETPTNVITSVSYTQSGQGKTGGKTVVDAPEKQTETLEEQNETPEVKTGGIPKKYFYIGGAAIAAIALVYLLTRKK